MDISTNNIRDRLNELRLRRDEAAACSVALGGPKDTPLLVAVDRSANDIAALLAEVERLSAQASGATLLNAVLGSLRADGWTVLAPGFGVPSADEPTDDYITDSPQCGTFTGIELVPAAEEEPLPEVTPEPLPDPGMVPRRGAFVKLCGEGPLVGRIVMLHEQVGNSWKGELLARAVELTNTIPMAVSAVVIIGPDPDKQPSLFTNTAPAPAETKAPNVAPAEATAPKATRSPEPPKPVTDWNPTDREIADMARIIGNGHTLESTKAMLAKYKEEKKNEPPRSRWRPDFCPKWALTQPKGPASA